MLPHAASSLAPNARRIRALVVDDEPIIRSLLHRALGRAGFEVLEATNGQAGLELARACQFDVVVSDVQMPLMNGLELLRRLKGEQPNLPVMLVSGHLEPREGESLGAFAVLRKPFSVDEVQRTALRALDTRSQVPVLARTGNG